MGQTPVDFTDSLLTFPESSFQGIGSVKNINTTDRGCTFKCLLKDSSSLSGTLTVWSDQIIRLQLGSRGTRSIMEGLMLCGKPIRIKPGLNDQKESLIISTSRVSLKINKTNGHISLLDKNGKILCRTDEGLGVCRFGLVHDGARFVGSFVMHANEHFYGMGEKFHGLSHRNQRIHSVQHNSNPRTEGFHTTIPFTMSSRGYGLFFHTPYHGLYDFGQTTNSTFNFAIDEPCLDLFFIAGDNYKELLGSYTQLTGRTPLIPEWAYGIWISRSRWKTQKEVEAVAHGFRERKLPCDVIKIDPGWFNGPDAKTRYDFDMEWNTKAFPEPESMLSKFKTMGFKTALFVNSWLMKDCVLAKKFRKKDLIAHTQDGKEVSWYMGKDNPVVQLDLTKEECRKLYKQRLHELMGQGVNTFFADWGINTSGEQAWGECDGPAYSNLHGLNYLRTVYEAVQEKTKGPAVIWGITGHAGVQRFPANYPGDSESTFRDMATILRGILNLAMSGVSIIGCDIGGFFGQDPDKGPDKELYIRYMQHGMLLPMTQFHGEGAREPWAYDDEVAEIYRSYAELRYKLIPYLVQQTQYSYRTGVPVIRPMVLEFSDDPNTAHLDTQYMLGSDLLVAPIVERGSTGQDVYLPQGTWINFWTDEIIQGPVWYHANAGLDTIPLFVRGGRILPLGPAMEYVGQIKEPTLELVLYPKNGPAVLEFDYKGLLLSVSLMSENDSFSLGNTGNSNLENLGITIQGIGGKKPEMQLIRIDGSIEKHSTHPRSPIMNGTKNGPQSGAGFGISLGPGDRIVGSIS